MWFLSHLQMTVPHGPDSSSTTVDIEAPPGVDGDGGSTSSGDCEASRRGEIAAGIPAGATTTLPGPDPSRGGSSRSRFGFQRGASMRTVRSTVAELDVVAMFEAGHRADALVVDEVFEGVFHPYFQWLLRMSALWTPAKRASWFERRMYAHVLRFVLVFCVFVCCWRLVTGGRGGPKSKNYGPAFHSGNSDWPFLLLHVWLVIAYFPAQQVLHSSYFIETLNSNGETRKSHLKEVRRISKLAGVLGLVAFVVFSGWISIAWTPSFYNKYYRKSDSPTRRVFGWVSFVSFIVIVVPWVAVLVCFAATFRIMLICLESDLVAIYEELFDAIEDAHTVASASPSPSSMWSRNQNRIVQQNLGSRRRRFCRSNSAGLLPAPSPPARRDSLGSCHFDDDVEAAASSRGGKMAAGSSAALSTTPTTTPPGDCEPATTAHRAALALTQPEIPSDNVVNSRVLSFASSVVVRDGHEHSAAGAYNGQDPHEPIMITRSRDILQATFKPKVMRFTRTLKGLCRILDLPLSLIIVIGLLNLWLPPRAWDPPHSWRGMTKLCSSRRGCHFLLRDLFIITIGFIWIYSCLWQTSQFTEAARRLNYLAGDVNHPNAIVALEIGRHVDRIDLSYTINEIAISRAFFVTFLEVLAIVATVICEGYGAG